MLSARLLLAITMVFTYPMECYVARHCVFAAINEYYVHRSDTANTAAVVSSGVSNPVQGSTEKDPEVNRRGGDSSSAAAEPPHITVHVAITLALWTVSVTIAIVFGDLAVIFALTGALSASFLGYILPSALYLTTYAAQVSNVISCCRSASPDFEPSLKMRISRVCPFVIPVVMLIFGIFALIVGVATVGYDLAQE